MAKVKYQPRFRRLSENVDFIPPLKEPTPAFVNYSVIDDGNVIICEFDEFDPKDFELQTCFASGVMPSELTSKLRNAKLVQLDQVDAFVNQLNYLEKLNS